MRLKIDEHPIRALHKYLSTHIVLLAASTGFAFTRLYNPNTTNLIERISWRIDDPSWVTPDFLQTTVIGQHYFGDFQLYMAWAASDNPYSISYAPTYLPFGHLLLKPLTLLPTNLAFMFFWAISLMTLFFAVKSIVSFTAPHLNAYEILNVFLFLFVFTTSTIVDFDRGNLHTFILGLMIGGVSCYLRKNISLGVMLILVASSFKPYLFILLVLFLEKENYKEALRKCAVYVFSSLVLYSLFQESASQALRSTFKALSRYGNEEGIPYILQSGSFVGSISRNIEFLWGRQSAESFLYANIFFIQAVSALLVLLGVLVWLQFSLPLAYRLFGLLSISSVAQAGSAAYQWGWLALVILLDLTFREEKRVAATFQKIVRIVIAFSVICALIPVWTWIDTPAGGEMQHPQFLVLAPLITLLNLVFFLVGVGSFLQSKMSKKTISA